MSDILKIIGEEVAYELHAAGLMVVKRPAAPRMDLPLSMIPQDRAYQWLHLEKDKALIDSGGWAPVPHSRHDGYFGPHGLGDAQIIESGCGLFDKPKFEVVAEQKAAIQRARDQSDKFFDGKGFVGSVKVSDGRETKVMDIEPDRTTRTRIPSDMVDHLAAIYAERDRIMTGKHGKDWEGREGLIDDKVRATEDAIQIVRQRLAAERPPGVIEKVQAEIAATKSIEDVSEIPADLMEYRTQIIIERDKIALIEFQRAWYGGGEYGKAFQQEFEAAERDRSKAWPIMHRLVLPTAIEIVRNRLKPQEATNEPSAPSGAV